ncbi:hypothetical protein [Seonamhaeicola sp. ML3]|uniref:hypothetical protein n=1 Tax=Seonamhaeicola sp. ML3 TaxID=2937786 RepID=UPI00200EFCB6|nr:hypothetical protein [Seonamhaeicola sp. ML3]
MLGLILVYFIGKRFYDLSVAYNQKKWLFAILGVASYYVGAIVIGGFTLGIIDGLFDLGIDWDNNLGAGLLALPFGLLTVYLFYILLKKKWEKTGVEVKDEIQDIGKAPKEDF